jgi:hypothetical protein
MAMASFNSTVVEAAYYPLWSERDLAQVEEFASRSTDIPGKPTYRYSGHLCLALAPLRFTPRWVSWDSRLKGGRWTKVPINPRTGRAASVSDPSTWGTFDEALAAIQQFHLTGVGVVLTGDDNLIGIDLDHCISDADSLSEIAAEIAGLAETYAEISPSGEGIRLFARGKIEGALKNDALGIEVYSKGRYLTVTGNKIEEAPDEIKEAPRTLARLKEVVETAREAWRQKSNGNGHAHAAGNDFFGNVNALALARLDAWVPALHPTARKHAIGAWRIPSRDLGRNLEEDLSYHPSGIADHGEEHGLTAIDAVLRYGGANDATRAAFWLCQYLGVEPAALGWKGKSKERPAATAEKVHADLHLSDDDISIKAWPIMESKATHGIVGRIARLATEHSEADPVAVIATTLAYAAAEFGRAQFIRIGDDSHHSRHFDAIVGQSSRARKGTSFGPVRRIFERAEAIRMTAPTLAFPSGCRLKVSNGPLSSGEGLVYAVRDGSDEQNGEDSGVPDKRLLVVEQELGAALRAFQRQGNNLSMILRMAFDGVTIAPLTKNNQTVATNPHINVVGHITRHELKDLFAASEIWNGLGNRFQWLMARRPKTVPFPRPMSDKDVEEIAAELARVIVLAHGRGKDGGHEMVMSNSAQAHWADVYSELTQDHPGILGAVTSRQEAHARRLALTYAQLDGAERIEFDHLEAALAFCRYAFDSAAYLFGGAELDPMAQTILKALAAGKKTQTEIRDLFGRHQPAGRLAAVLSDLQERGRITLTEEQTGGRPRKVWGLNT